MFLFNRGSLLARSKQACPVNGFLWSHWQQQCYTLPVGRVDASPRRPSLQSSPYSTTAITMPIRDKHLDQRLPDLNSDYIQQLQFGEEADCSTAYNMILQAEQHALLQHDRHSEYFITAMDHHRDMIASRVAGYLLLEFHARSDVLGDAPCKLLVNRVMSPPDSETTKDNMYDNIYRLGKLCRDRFIRLFRKPVPIGRGGSRTFELLHTPPLGRPFDTVEEMTKYYMKATESDYVTIRRKVLARDGFRCIHTNRVAWDFSYICPELSATTKHMGAIGTAHIIRDSTTQIIDPMGIFGDDTVENMDEDSNLHAMPILEFFGFSHIAKALTQPGGIHQPWNLLSLQDFDLFDELDMWFESTGQPNSYRLCAPVKKNRPPLREHIPRRFLVNGDSIIEFNPHFEGVPPPDPQLLALHAACARVTHMANASEFFRDMDVEELTGFDPYLS